MTIVSNTGSNLVIPVTGIGRGGYYWEGFSAGIPSDWYVSTDRWGLASIGGNRLAYHADDAVEALPALRQGVHEMQRAPSGSETVRTRRNLPTSLSGLEFLLSFSLHFCALLLVTGNKDCLRKESVAGLALLAVKTVPPRRVVE